MNWLRRHKIFAITAGVVLALSLFVVGSFLMGGGSTIVGQAGQSVLAAIEKPLSSVTGGIKSALTGVFRYTDVMEENEALRQENADLKQENLDLALQREELDELRDLSGAFSFTPYEGRDNAVAGRIISLDNSNPFHTFLIDVGSDLGISKNDVVVDGNGLVGRIREVGGSWSKVVSILDENNNVSFKVLHRGSVQGVVHGDGNDALSGYVLDEDAEIVSGDILVTSGVGIYPQGIRIGVVEDVTFNEDLQLKVITATPTVTFTSLQKVAVFP